MMPLPMWGGTKETGVLTRALAGNLRFRQTSSALGRTFVGPPPSTSRSLSPHVTLWESRDLVSRGWKSGPRRLISIVGRTIGHRLPF